MTLVNKQQYAVHRGCTKAYLSKKSVKELLAKAMEVDPADGKLKVNLEKADELFAANRDESKYIGRKKPEKKKPAPEEPGQNPEPEEGSYHNSRAQLEQVKLENAKIELLHRKGELLYRREVIDAAAAAAHKIQEQMRALSRRLAEKVATMTDQREIKTLIEDEFRMMLELSANEFERKIGKPGGQTSAAPH